MKVPRSPLAAALWSVAIPGFGQLYNRRFAKGLIFIVLEFLINLNSHLNLAIYYTWLFDIPQSQRIINYEWLLFYPCVYVFGIFDAYHDCCQDLERPYPRLLVVPFFASSFIGTILVVLSSGPVQVLSLDRIGPVFVGVILMLLLLGGGSWAIHRYSPKP
ncbi:hypothetical protein [Gorillibacterium sp. sgz5001074]|uniref:hypothetical protein n=1 Tax=Gorillibacterium sp. sgz5001074 TaxID=3446695 RepID=UPI003F66438F